VQHRSRDRVMVVLYRHYFRGYRIDMNILLIGLIAVLVVILIVLSAMLFQESKELQDIIDKIKEK
jgi:hypothetical protein